MEQLKRIVQAAPLTDDALVNVVREYLQVLVLKLLFHGKGGRALSFVGGTCLRICYDLKRYSEDLDFCLDAPTANYQFAPLLRGVRQALQQRGFIVTATIHEEKIVQKAFLRFDGFHEALGIRGFRQGQKIHLKVEVDAKPLVLRANERESVFVSRFQEIFPIVKHNLATLFAGKVLAILYRPYTRGRDYYDLIWYLNRKAPLNLEYLNRGQRRPSFASLRDVVAALTAKVTAVKPQLLLKDISRFLEDPSEAAWIADYQQLFRQLVQQWG
ncbi:MAG: nucleotidyl transferase AbiEii/AbiGii toxin family protein [Deltaproteobacteria bacterium]|nr:nucleotidyl transferase AbiEii/AbiGii toxin family protein [Deltaproteobacteria bacterium]